MCENTAFLSPFLNNNFASSTALSCVASNSGKAESISIPVGVYNNPTTFTYDVSVFSGTSTLGIPLATSTITTLDSSYFDRQKYASSTFTTQPFLNLGQTYTFLFSYVSGGGDVILASSTGNGYYDGDGRWFVETTIPSISFIFPTNNATTTDFNYWQTESNIYDLSGYNTSGGFWKYRVHYSRLSSSTLENTDILYIPSAAVATGSVFSAISKSQPLIFPPLVDGTTYYAQADILDASNSLVVQSDIVSFGVYFTPATGTTAGLPLTSSTIPIVNNFIQLYNDLSTKPPIGYFTAIKNALNSLSVGTTSLVLINATTTQAFSAIFTPLRTGIEFILWFMFAFWIFHRLRYLEL